ncbi:hypothetical protein N7454_010667 [Penicillium verhagenii]|nr:hypothetical protein N7454_010667 [Penicillium verhagenii]
MSLPTFHFLDPLNQISGPEADSLLGRFVLDRWNLLEGYEPKDPTKIITPEFISEDLDFGNVEMFITTVSHTSANAAARKALTIGGSRTSAGGVALSSDQITKRGIKNARSAFEALTTNADIMTGVQNMMRNAGVHRIWMITGILLVSDGHVKTNALKASEVNFKAAAQFPTAAAAGISPVGLEALDIDVAEISIKKKRNAEAGLEADLMGRRVFAVQYWRCDHPRWKPQQLLGQWRGQMTLRGKGLQKVDTGHMGLGESEDEDEEDADADCGSQSLVLGSSEELPGLNV